MTNPYADAIATYCNVAKTEDYLPLVKRIASRMAMFLPPHIEEDDLVGHGVFGLLDALERFDPSRGVKFETYASLRIRGSIIDGLRMMDWVPHSARQRVKRVQEAFVEIENKVGRAATLDEVALNLNISRKGLDETLMLGQVLSLTYFDETSTGDEGESKGPILNNISDTEAQDAFQLVENEERLKIMEEAINKLPEKEKLVVALYYQEELNLKEIAAVLKLSESRISQLHSKAILRLRGRLSRQKKNLL